MKIKQLFLLFSFVCAANLLVAQTDTVPVSWLDTVRLQDEPATVSDTWLLDMIQSARLSANADTADLLVGFDTLGYIMVDTISGDTLWTVAQVLERDSIRREIALMDSLKALNAQLEEQTHEVPVIAVQRSLVKDAEEDQRDVMRAIRNMHTPWRKEATSIA